MPVTSRRVNTLRVSRMVAPQRSGADVQDSALTASDLPSVPPFTCDAMEQNNSERAVTRIKIDPASRATPASDDGRVLLHLDTGRMCAINAMGSRIWSELDAGHSLQEIIDVLAAEYDAPRERVEADVRAFVAQLASKQYVHTPGAKP